jgi:hypothetical protein
MHKRQGQDCIVCPVNPPACPACPSGQECQITSQSCQQCAQSQCISSSTLNGITNTGSAAPSKSNTGAIAGGIVAALILAGVAAGVLFWYLRKKKQRTEDLDVWLNDTAKAREDEKLSPATTSHDSVLPFCCCLTIERSVFVACFNRHDNDTCFKRHSHRLHCLSTTDDNDVYRHRGA